MAEATEVVQAWHDAVNSGDIDAAVALCAEDVAVRGPRGIGHGHDLMRGWLERSGIRLAPQDPLVETDGRLVVREHAWWTTAEAPPDAPTVPTETWCVFSVSEGRVTSVARYDSADEVPPIH